MISQLPDELLIQILSLLPDADATRSRILSCRWKHLWAFLPNLHIVMPQFKEEANKFNDSVDRILALRADLPIQKFFLQCSYYGSGAYRVNNWLRIVNQCKVEELKFRFYDTIYWDLFRTDTLIKFTIEGSGVLVIPEVETLFPCL
ncbi:F-box protein At1g19070-like [Rutidosis leptorrhynchoides]|uniref:F-box protein At1g19070-like n=1 Tax=Rutidosis leptorrhynchoides TaxID=125765 RepID=UPI003A99204F